MYLFKLVADLVRFEERATHKTLHWEPFNKETPIARRVFTLETNNLKEVIKEFNNFCVEIDAQAKQLCKNNPKFNGYKAWVKLPIGQRKPQGWNKTRATRFEKEFETTE